MFELPNCNAVRCPLTQPRGLSRSSSKQPDGAHRQPPVRCSEQLPAAQRPARTQSVRGERVASAASTAPLLGAGLCSSRSPGCPVLQRAALLCLRRNGLCLHLEKVVFLHLCLTWFLADLNSLYFLFLGFSLTLRILHLKEGACALCWPRVSYAASQQRSYVSVAGIGSWRAEKGELKDASSSRGNGAIS